MISVVFCAISSLVYVVFIKLGPVSMWGWHRIIRSPHLSLQRESGYLYYGSLLTWKDYIYNEMGPINPLWPSNAIWHQIPWPAYNGLAFGSKLLQAINCTNGDLLSIKLQSFSFKRMHLKISYTKCCPYSFPFSHVDCLWSQERNLC